MPYVHIGWFSASTWLLLIKITCYMCYLYTIPPKQGSKLNSPQLTSSNLGFWVTFYHNLRANNMSKLLPLCDPLWMAPTTLTCAFRMPLPYKRTFPHNFKYLLLNTFVVTYYLELLMLYLFTLEESLSITTVCCDLAIATHARKMHKWIFVVVNLEVWIMTN